MRAGGGPVALVILDGWGVGPETPHNAITAARPTTFQRLWDHYPHALLAASGPAVGLPAGTCGNSEVGHLTLGAGRIIRQPLSRIDDLIEGGILCDQPVLSQQFSRLAHEHGALHLIGLVSEGKVHSDQQQLHALIHCAAKSGIERVFVHAILDGRDTPAQSAATYLEQLEAYCATAKIGTIASLCGRFYAMDRDGQWDRTCAAFRLYTEAPKVQEQHWRQVLAQYYKDGVTDEFIPPTSLHAAAFIRPEDGILLFNVRPDRMRQLTALLLGRELTTGRGKTSPPCGARVPYRFLISAVRYASNFNNPVLLEPEEVDDTLLDHLQTAGLRIFTIAETEKYAHVTYFFSGGREAVRPDETRVMIPSLGIRDYAAHPCMSAPTITERVVAALRADTADFYLINYANADMVGHTGNFEATVAAVSCVDKQLHTLFEELVQKRGASLFIVGDHGNAEEKWDAVAGRPRTAHTSNPVPFIAVNVENALPPMRGLSDVAAVVEENMAIQRR
ncbi:MAG: 2,3-bisphosphoglycerate-independent phosphoglycerate mutase [Candidatus Dependentiae bacterium]|nr:2,3-bisphosphoglycerate-independent phosphoglycerate mutase [Candidatus Dependentiae bacterium]